MKKIWTTIEITGTEVKLLQTRKKRRGALVTFCAIRSLTGRSENEAGRLLREMKEQLAMVPEMFLLLVPRRLVILKIMKLPSRDDREIRDMIGLQLVNNIPYPIDEVTYQYQILGHEEGGYSRILVIVMPREVHQRYERIMHFAGVKKYEMTLASLGLGHWWNQKTSGKDKQEVSSTAVLFLDARHSELCFFDQGKFCFSRQMPFGHKHLHPKSLHGFTRQVKLSIEFYQKECSGTQVESIVIVSKSSEAGILNHHLTDQLMMPVDVMSPLTVEDHQSESVVEMLKVHPAVSITAGLGWVWLTDRKKILSLIPKEIHESKEINSERIELMKCAVLFLVVAFLTVLIRSMPVYNKEQYVQRLEQRIKQMESRLKEADQKIEFVKTFNKKIEAYYFIPDLVYDLAVLTPETISFRSISLDKAGDVLMQGYAQSHAEIYDFQGALIQSPHFQAVDLKFATKKEIANTAVVDFKMASQLGHLKAGGSL